MKTSQWPAAFFGHEASRPGATAAKSFSGRGDLDAVDATGQRILSGDEADAMRQLQSEIRRTPGFAQRGRGVVADDLASNDGRDFRRLVIVLRKANAPADRIRRI